MTRTKPKKRFSKLLPTFIDRDVSDFLRTLDTRMCQLSVLPSNLVQKISAKTHKLFIWSHYHWIDAKLKWNPEIAWLHLRKVFELSFHFPVSQMNIFLRESRTWNLTSICRHVKSEPKSMINCNSFCCLAKVNCKVKGNCLHSAKLWNNLPKFASWNN